MSEAASPLCVSCRESGTDKLVAGIYRMYVIENTEFIVHGTEYIVHSTSYRIQTA